jgi:hypothetical protein
MQKITSTAAPRLAAAPLSAARLSSGSAIVFLGLVAALHFLKPELDPSWRFISEYATGEFGWIMTAAFLFLALSSLSLFAAVRSQIRTTGGRLGLAILSLSAAGMVLAAFNAIDPITAGPDELTTHGSLHALGTLLGIPTFPVAASLVSWGLARNPAWSPARRSLRWAAGFTWVGLAVMLGALFIMLGQNGGKFGPEVLIGWPNRLLVATYCAWLITVARFADRRF